MANADAANGDFKVLTGSIYDLNGRIWVTVAQDMLKAFPAAHHIEE